MKYIIEIDGENSTEYKYNVYTVWDDFGTIDHYTQDERIFFSDRLSEFLEFMKMKGLENNDT